METTRAKATAKLAAVPGVTADAARDIETCVFNFTLRRCKLTDVPLQWDERRLRDMYIQKIIGIHFNLTNPKNPGLLQRVLAGSMGIRQLVNAHPAHLFPEMWDEIFERVAAKQLRKQLTQDIDTVPDGAVQCSKCRSRKTVYFSMQTRSADEPMTLFFECLACHKRWKQ